TFVAVAPPVRATAVVARSPKSYTVGVSTSVAPHITPVAPHPVAKLVQISPPEDQWARRMKFLVQHGTSSLEQGEAFMFSEETGEGVLFLKEGGAVRRKIAEPRNAYEVARSRRPDVLS